MRPFALKSEFGILTLELIAWMMDTTGLTPRCRDHFSVGVACLGLLEQASLGRLTAIALGEVTFPGPESRIWNRVLSWL